MLRCLLVSPIYTNSPLTGGGQRTLHLYRALARLGTVDVVFISESVCVAQERDLPAFRNNLPLAGHVGFYRSTEQFLAAPEPSAGLVGSVRHAVRRVVRALRPRSHFFQPSAAAKAELGRLIETRGYDVIVGRYLQTTALSGALDQSDVPVVVDLDDLDDAVLLSRMRSPTTTRIRRWVLRFQALQVASVSKRFRARCRHVFTATEADRAAVRHASSSVLPNIPYRRDDAAAPHVASAGRTLLFVGSHGHRANQEGITYFVTSIWPQIRRRAGDARFRIVGSGGWDLVRAELEATDGVDVVGLVDDLSREYAGAALCVAPVFEGSGTKIKILEALMYGRVVVAAAHSSRGLDDLLAGGMVAAASDAEMVEQVVALLADPARRAELVKDGRRLISERYSPEAVFRIVADALARVRPGAGPAL